jgi:monoamine oxidase
MEGLRSGKDLLPFKGTLKGKLFGQEVQYIQKWIDLVNQKGVSYPEVQALDKISVEEMLKKGGAPKDIIDLYTYTNATESTTVPSKMSALYMVLANTRTSAFNENTEEGRIFGGNDQLPKIFAKKLGTKIKYNRSLQSLVFDSKGVIATIEENGKKTTIKGIKCVLAIPASILRNININPGFSTEKINCIQKQQYGHAMKIAMQYRRRFWDDKNSIGQRVFTDTSLRRIYHFSIDQPGPRGILLSFTSGEDAIKLGRLDENKRVKIAQNTCKNIWPESPQYWEKGITKYWNEDPWVKASYSLAGIGQKGFREILAKREGPVFFAGEHTAVQRASMNGAIESGLRVMEELKRAVKV